MKLPPPLLLLLLRSSSVNACAHIQRTDSGGHTLSPPVGTAIYWHFSSFPLLPSYISSGRGAARASRARSEGSSGNATLSGTRWYTLSLVVVTLCEHAPASHYHACIGSAKYFRPYQEEKPSNNNRRDITISFAAHARKHAGHLKRLKQPLDEREHARHGFN